MGYRDAQAKIFQLLGYKPTLAEVKVHNDGSRNKLVAGGERAGKSRTNAMELISHWFAEVAARKGKRALYWLLGNDYEGCRGEWDHLVENFQKLEVLAEPPTKNIDPGLIHLQDGTKIVTKSAKYPEKIATLAPDGILICEAAQVDYEVFLRARARLAEKRGWMCMAGTFEEEGYIDWYRELYELGQSYNELELKSFSLPTWSNTIIFPGGKQDSEILKQEKGMTPERFMERFGGVPCPKTGRVITEFANVIHVKECPFNPDLPVEIAVDPGYAGASVVLAIQEVGEQIILIDEIYVQGVVTQGVLLIAQKKPWWNAVIGGAIDISGTAHPAMDAPVEVWLREGKVSLRSKKIRNVEDGIDLLRTHLKQHPITGKPGILVDPKCRGFIAECGGGRSPVEGGGIWMRDKNTLKPLKKDDHACKALIYYLVNKFGYVGRHRIIEPIRWAGSNPQPTFVRT